MSRMVTRDTISGLVPLDFVPSGQQSCLINNLFFIGLTDDLFFRVVSRRFFFFWHQQFKIVCSFAITLFHKIME